jgi:hypothetical protein
MIGASGLFEVEFESFEKPSTIHLGAIVRVGQL